MTRGDSEPYYLKAYELDSTLYMALFKLYWLYHQTNRNDEADSLMQEVSKFEMSFTPWERARYDAIMATTPHEFAEADYRRYLIDPFEESANYQAALTQMISKNDPITALEILKSYPEAYGDRNTDSWRIHLWMKAYYMLEMYEESVGVLDSVDWPVQYTRDHVRCLFSSLVRLGDTIELKRQYDRRVNTEIQWVEDNRYLAVWICNEADVIGKEALVESYARKLLALSSDNDQLSRFFRGQAHYWLGDYSSALEGFQSLDPEQLPRHGNAAGGYPHPRDIKAWIAVCASRLNKMDLVVQVLSESEGVPYLPIVAYTAMGDLEKATNATRVFITSYKYPYLYGRLQDDCMLKSLIGYESFDDLVEVVKH